MHQYPNLGHPYCPYLLHPVCIVWWKPGCLCMPVCLCPSHLICVATPCLECVHALVHAFMSTWLPMSAPVPMHSLMETLVSLYGCLFVSQLHHFCSHTLFRTCTCISTWIYVHLTVHVCSLPLCLVSWKLGCPYLSLCLCPIHPASGPTPCLKCVHASLHEFMSTWLPISGPPPMHSFIETGCPCIAVCLCPSNLICSLTLFRMCTCISTCNYVHLTAQVWPRSYA